MINEYYIYNRWEKIDRLIEEDEIYKNDKYRIEALSYISFNHMFLANNRAGYKHFYIEFAKGVLANYKPIQINGLSVVISNNSNLSKDKEYLSISLVDLSLEEAFLSFTTSIAIRLLDTHDDFTSINVIENVFKMYLNFFDKRAESTLSEIQEQGLFAELFELYSQINEKGESAITSWEGPDKRRRDFIFEDCEIEIKSSINLNEKKITVTGEKQLEPIDIPLYLHVYSLEKITVGMTVKSLYDSIIKKVSDITYKKIFLGKLSLLGIPADSYNPLNAYRVIDISRYEIDENFPRINSKNIPKEVYDVKYKINLNGIKGEKILK